MTPQQIEAARQVLASRPQENQDQVDALRETMHMVDLEVINAFKKGLDQACRDKAFCAGTFEKGKDDEQATNRC